MKKKFTILIAAAVMLLTMMATTGTMWGQTKITDYNDIVSGKKYYIGATTGSTDYYLSVSGSSLTQSIAGTAVTSVNSATSFIFAGSGTTWTIQFDDDNGYYLSLKDGKDNGKVQVVENAASFTASNQSQKIRLTKGSYSIQKNNSGTQFGSYANTQTDIWLMEVPTGGDTYTVTFDSGTGTFNGNDDFPNESNTLTAGTYTLPTATPADGYTFDGWTATGITNPITGSYTVSEDVDFIASYSEYTPGGDMVIDFENAANTYSDWTFTNMTSKQTGTITAHGDTYYGTTGGKATASITTKTTIATPSLLTCYVSKQSTNTTSSTWYIQVSLDGADWTDVTSRSATDMEKGVWKEFSADLSSYSDVYVRVYYSGSTAVRNIDDLTLTTSVPTVATPAFSPEEGVYPGAQNVTIACETDGATIYYTTNGDTPTNESTPYNGAISVTETTTIKAIAYVDNEASYVASATYTIVTPLTTMQQVYEDAVANTSEHEVYITFNNWVITGTNGGSASQFFLTDPDNTYGCVIYGSGSGFTRGNTLNGTVRCKLLYFSSSSGYSFAEIKELTTQTDGLTVGTGGNVTPITTTIDDLTFEKTGTVVKLENLTYNGTVLTDNNNNTINNCNYIYSATLTSGKTYHITGVFVYAYTQNDTPKRICPRSADDIVEATNPTLSINPTAADPFTYVFNNGPSDDQMFEVTGTNLASTDIIATITAGDEYFEITDDEEYSSTVTVNSGDYISIRMKAGLAKGPYEGTLTLSTEGASNVEVALSGTVTGTTYTIESIASNGTISFNPASPVEDGIQVTMTATPTEGYEFEANSWKFYNANTLDEVTLDVTDGNKITMPAYDLAVDATFTEKPKYAITKVVTPENSGTIATDDTAWEGKEVTVLVEAASGYAFLSIVISKTDEPETTIETSGNVNDGFTFTMPGYAVTATATFISNVFEGSFIKVTTLDALEDGGYYVLYDTKAMNSTISSGKMGATVVEVVDDVITKPNRAIVWKLVKNGDNWDLFSEKEAKYCYISTTSSTSAFVMALSSFYHYNISKYDDGGFKFQTTASGGRGIGFGGNEDFRTYTSGNNPKVYLYKYTVLTERTITFDGNGGETENEETTYTQTVYDGVATNLDPNQFTFGSSIFMGWSTTQDGEVEYADEASITVNGDITLYAQWETGYTAMVDDDIDGGSVYIVTATGNEEIIEAAAGTEITLTYTADLGYAFSAWNVYYTDENEQVVPVEVNDDKFTMPAYDVTISAGFEEVTTYSLVTNIDQIVSGKHYIIVGKKNNVVKAMGYDKGNNRHAVEVSETNSTIAKTDGVYEFVINGPIVIDETNYYTIYDTNEESTGYLYAPNTSGKNYLKTQTVNDNKGQWTIGIAATSSVATIVANVSDRNTMQYNEANAIFSCYSSASQQDVYLYVKVNDNDLEYYGTEINYAQDEIPADETITVGTGSVMTVPSTFTNTNSANLIIEDGGQLIHNVPVSATIQRNVKGYNANRDANNSGYMLIASPVSAPINVTSTNLINGNYDLYIFDEGQQDNEKEWRNYKANEFTTIANTKGYLYANESNGTISFAGELKPSINPVTINLDYTDGNRFAGWNLVGNPFACNAYAYDTIGKSLAFFKMNTTGDGFVAVTTGAIAPMEGIFVKASEAGQNFAFTKEAPVSNPGKGNLNIQVAQANTGRDAQHISDNAIIRFDGGNNLEKFSFNDYGDKLYFTLGNKDYSVFNAEARGEMPVNFKAAENGTYTIDFSMDNVEFSYLHLIDNKTGMDIDLLQTSSYTFEASKIDYASRFKLVFSTNSNSYSNDDNDFAFFDANGNLLILGNEGTATLQVIDITGRTVSNETFSGDYSKAISAKAGVYMLRLIQGNDVRTQKIVVR